jgi:uncharacterized protein YgiM (DUF1202 family)
VIRRLALCAALAALPAAAQAPRRVVVTAPIANLRPVAADNVEILAQIEAGRLLSVLGPPSGAWLPVEPPDEVSVWIYAELVRDGAAAVNKAQIRAGPGLAYRTVGSVNRGTPLETRGRLGDWLRIRLPAGMPVWVSRAAVAPAASNAPPPGLRLPPAVASGLIAALQDTNTAASAAATNAAGSHREGREGAQASGLPESPLREPSPPSR